jgi:hypothetical protein
VEIIQEFGYMEVVVSTKKLRMQLSTVQYAFLIDVFSSAIIFLELKE